MDRFIIEKILDITLIVFFIFISYKDLKEKIIPDRFCLGIVFLGILKIIFCGKSFEESFIGFSVYPAVLIIIYGYGAEIMKKDIVGFGDIKLLGAVGFYIGYLGIYNLIVLYNIIFILGFVFSIFLLITKKAERKTEIPFAPIICLGAVLFKTVMNL